MSEHRIEFRLAENPWAPAAVVAELNERHGCGLELIGLSEQLGGVGSAAFVRWPDGRESALVRTKTPLHRMRQTAEVVELARAAGIPAPRHEFVVQLGDGAVAVVQERMPGRHATRIDAGVTDAMVAMNNRFAHLLADRPDIPYPAAFPTPDHNPWEQTLGQYSDRSRKVLRRVRELDGSEPYAMTGDDLVHTDYSLGNVLFDEGGQISGVVDWNFGADRGDRWYALLGMRSNLRNEGDGYQGTPKALARLEEVLSTQIDPELMRIYLAHGAVHGVHISIRDFPHRPDRIERSLEAAESELS